MRALAAEFQVAGDQALARDGGDLAAGLRAAGEGDLGDARVARKRGAGGMAEARDHVEHAVGISGLRDQFGKGERRGGGMFRRLDHHRVADRERRRDRAGHHVERRVPRHDHTDHAERFAQGEVERVGLVHRDDVALDLVGHAGEVAVVARQIGELGTHLADQLAVVAGLELGQRLGVLRDQVGEAVEQPPPVGRQHGAPGRIAHGARRRRDRVIDILLARIRRPAPGRAGARVEAFEIVARRGRPPVTPDIDRQVRVFDTLHCELHRRRHSFEHAFRRRYRSRRRRPIGIPKTRSMSIVLAPGRAQNERAGCRRRNAKSGNAS